MPVLGSVRIGVGTLGFQLAVAFGATTLSNGATTLGSRTATCGSRATSSYATRDVVAREDDLEVVRDERAHEAIRVANLVLRLIRLHHREVGIGALHRLLFITVRLRASMIPCRIHLACVLVDTDIGGVLLAQFATDRSHQIARNNFCYNNKFSVKHYL